MDFLASTAHMENLHLEMATFLGPRSAILWISLRMKCIRYSRDDSYKWLNIGFGEGIGTEEIKYAPYPEPWLPNYS